MSGQQLFSDMDTSTLADVLKAVGVAETARLWFQALGYPSAPITLRDLGRCYQIDLPAALDETTIAATTHAFPVGPHPSTFQSSGTPATTLVSDQSGAAPAHDASGEQSTGGPTQANKKSPEAHADHSARPSLLDQDRFRCLQVLQGDTRYQMLWRQWNTDQIERFQHHLRLVVQLFSQSPNPTAAAIKHWNNLSRQRHVTGPALVKRLQVINPAAGKGAHALKAGRLPIGNPSEFWLLEYMKFIGFLSLALPVWQPASHDWKVYVLRPTRLELSTLPDLLTHCQTMIRTTTSVKQDILALLEGTRLSLVQGNERTQRPNPSQPQTTRASADWPPAPAEDRFDVAWYKDMGHSHALMQLATLPLPRWLRPWSPPQEAERIIRLIKSQERLILSLQSPEGYEGAVELTLLQLYRDALAGHHLDQLYAFAARYGHYALIRRARKDHMPYFPLAEMEALMTQGSPSPTYSSILENQGFEAVAAAIRSATISAQYWSARDPQYPYEVRHQLGQTLLQAASRREELLIALHTFLLSYNRENARIDAQLTKHPLLRKPYYRRPWLKDTQVKQFLRLLDTFPSALIGTMLAGYGSAWPTVSDEPSPPERNRTSPAESVPFLALGADRRRAQRSVQAHRI
jgi:hypothetical protein